MGSPLLPIHTAEDTIPQVGSETKIRTTELQYWQHQLKKSFKNLIARNSRSVNTTTR